MQIDIKKAYQYYVDNIHRSCNNKILSEQDFHQAFAQFLNSLEIMHVMQSNLVDVPIYNEKCGTSRFVNLEIVLNKII